MLAHLKVKYEIHSFCEYNPLPFIIKIPAHNHLVLWLSAQQHNKIAICQLLFFCASYRRNDYNTLVYFLKLVEKLLWIPHSSLNIFFYSNILNNWFLAVKYFIASLDSTIWWLKLIQFIWSNYCHSLFQWETSYHISPHNVLTSIHIKFYYVMLHPCHPFGWK